MSELEAAALATPTPSRTPLHDTSYNDDFLDMSPFDVSTPGVLTESLNTFSQASDVNFSPDQLNHGSFTRFSGQVRVVVVNVILSSHLEFVPSMACNKTSRPQVHHILAGATHHMLLGANVTYRKMFEELRRLQQERENTSTSTDVTNALARVEKEIAKVQAHLKHAHSDGAGPKNTTGEPSQHLPCSGSIPNSIYLLYPQLPRNENVVYWDKHVWLNALNGPDRVNLGGAKPKTFDFLEDEDGVTLSTAKRNELNEFAELCYSDMLRRPHEFGVVIEHWSRDSTTKTFNFVAINLYPRFPELRLCDADWKLQAYLVQHYPTWYKNRKEECATRKQDLDRSRTHSAYPQATGNSVGTVTSQKRSVPAHEAPLAAASKKPRVISALSGVRFTPVLHRSSAAGTAPTNQESHDVAPALPRNAMPPIPHGSTPANTNQDSHDVMPTTAGVSGEDDGRVRSDIGATDQTSHSETPTTADVSREDERASADIGVTSEDSHDTTTTQLHGTTLTTPDMRGEMREDERVSADPKQGLDTTDQTTNSNGRKNPDRITAKTLCRQEWYNKNPSGLEKDFEVYWKDGTANDIDFKKSRASKQQRVQKKAMQHAGVASVSN
ncbi:hypothetical protein BC835DRAFT_1412461 [Cytidiella melzeri]|nr:hypothetical protein BC835DRAFT_1412461 [Cytidiella melzeri]